MATLNLVGASIDAIQDALSSGALTSVELVALYLRRIARYDCQGPSLNSVPVLNPDVFQEAAASDDRRRQGMPVRPLEGVPYTVKDSYKVKGMTVACGSPAFEKLIANEDAYTVAAIRGDGGVLIGKTNMPPMAYGGMQRGIYGRAESPYNPACLPAAWWSGSSNGSAVATAASLAAFGMAEETVSSGRSPASNNALVAYTPSRGWLSIRGNWPLYPTCDVVVPHTRTMGDMLRLLCTLATIDHRTSGDFWRHQPFIKLEKPWKGSAVDLALVESIAETSSLEGIRIAVPSMYVGGDAPDGATPAYTSKGVKRVWQRTHKELELLGAEVVIVPDFPAVTAYENPGLLPKGAYRLPEDWNSVERGPLVAHAWNMFLLDCADPGVPDLSSVDEFNIFPHSMRAEAEVGHMQPANALHWGRLANYTQEMTVYEIPKLGEAIRGLEAMRKQLHEEYLDKYNCDCFAFPSQGDVALADSDVNHESAAHAIRNGVWYSNGNRAFRHLGIPSVTVPMGVNEDNSMPVGLTFAGRAYDDENLLRWANAFENKTKLRNEPSHTPALESDIIKLEPRAPVAARAGRPELEIEVCETSRSSTGRLLVKISGVIKVDAVGTGAGEPMKLILNVTVNGQDVAPSEVSILHTEHCGSERFAFEVRTSTTAPRAREERDRTLAPVARDQTMVVVLARINEDGDPAGALRLVQP